MTEATAEAIVNLYNAARELQSLAADAKEKEVLDKLMEIRKFALEGILGATK
jgi:hypothetical protein